MLQGKDLSRAFWWLKKLKTWYFFVEDDILSLLWVIAFSELYIKSLSGTRADDLGCLKVKEKHVFKHFLVAEHAPPCLWVFLNMFPHSNLVSAPVILESKCPQRLEVQRFVLVQQFEHLKYANKDFLKQLRNTGWFSKWHPPENISKLAPPKFACTGTPP